MPRTTPLLAIVEGIVPQPTASFMEHRAIAYLRQFAADRRLAYAQDAYGNVYLAYRRGRSRRPLVLGAHLDHPGFVVTAVHGTRLDLEFRGGLSGAYGKGEVVRIYGNGQTRARITSIQTEPGSARGDRWLRGARATLLTGDAAVRVGDLALWDVDVCRVRGERLHARQCDDLVGAAGVLAALDRAAAQRQTGHLIGLFTRAEEVGLLGATAAARDGMVPENAIVIAVETSSMAGGRAAQRAGPIVRVGDRQHVFSPAVTRWMVAAAEDLQRKHKRFQFQRKLMDGGTTEATAYALFGYETGAVCLSLGHYHNAGAGNHIRAETIHLADLEGLVALFGRLLDEVPAYPQTIPAMMRRYEQSARSAAARLRSTAIAR